jgi:selenocysteine-specific translation elongation factor
MEPEYTKVGKIDHFYSKASVAVVEVSAPIKNGDKILIRGGTTNLSQVVESMEVEHKQVNEAQAGQRIGLKVAGRVRENDIVYKVAEA